MRCLKEAHLSAVLVFVQRQIFRMPSFWAGLILVTLHLKTQRLLKVHGSQIQSACMGYQAELSKRLFELITQRLEGCSNVTLGSKQTFVQL